MSWWTARPLRTKIFLAFSALLLAMLLATLGATQFVLSRDAQRTLNRELSTAGQVLEELMAQRAARLQTSSTLLAGDFALKRVIATHFDAEEYDPETLASAALSYQQRLGVELVWIADEHGVLLATSSGRPRSGTALAAFSPLREALETRDAAAAITEVDGSLYQFVAVPVLAPDVIGFLLLGQIIDDALAQRLEEDTGSHVSFITEGRVFASSWPAASRKLFIPDAGQLEALSRGSAVPQASLLTLSGTRFLALVVPMAAKLPRPLQALMQGSYDEALAPLRSLQRRIGAIGVVALALALAAGVRLAGGITAPVQALVTGMREVLRGNLRYRSTIARQDEIGFLARSFNEMVGGLEEREHIKDTFGRFVSRDVAEAVLSGRVPLDGERREVSILFQDIRGFTALSEQLEPASLLKLLNQFFTEVVAAVEAEGGVVKQFTGDGVMALFGAPQAYADHAERAVRAALGIVRRLGGLNATLRQQGIPALSIGIGIHAGVVVAGLIGPDQRVEYGVVGEPVNTASRVESLTKDVQAIVLVSKEIAARLGNEFVLGRKELLSVKGKTLPVEVVEVLGFTAVAVKDAATAVSSR